MAARWPRAKEALGRVPQLPVPPRPPDGSATYVGTTWPDGRRVAARALRRRGACDYWLEPDGLVLRRRRAPVVAVHDVVAVDLSGGHAGHDDAPGRVVLVAWTLGRQTVRTALDLGDAARAATFAAALANSAGMPVSLEDTAADAADTKEPEDGR